MISATGKTRPPARRRAFTLIEIILVLALIALASGLVISNFAAFADRGDSRTTEETLAAAIRKARFAAAAERTVSELSFDKESGSLFVDGEGAEPLAFPLDEAFAENGRAEIRFYLVPASKGFEPFPEPERTGLETDTVRFAPDRSSAPFVVEIDLGSGTPRRIAYDPFSSLRRASAE